MTMTNQSQLKTITQMIHSLELQLKTLVISNANRGISKNVTINLLSSVIKKNLFNLKNIDDYSQYEIAVKYWSNYYVNKYYSIITKNVTSILAIMTSLTCVINAPKAIGKRLKTLKQKSSYSQIETILENKETLDYFRRGYPAIENYIQEVKNVIKQIALPELSEIPTYDEANDRVYVGRTLIAKAERAVRYKNQMQHLNDLRNSGVVNVWVTAHVNCSKRCEKWQGRTYTLDGQTRVIDGKTFIPIEEAINVFVKTKSGKVWRNGLFGFNCRHEAVPYTSNSKVPIKYSSKDIETQRNIEKEQRKCERKLYRLYKLKYIYANSNSSRLIQEAKELNIKFKFLENKYLLFCKKYNVPAYPERYKIKL